MLYDKYNTLFLQTLKINTVIVECVLGGIWISGNSKYSMKRKEPVVIDSPLYNETKPNALEEGFRHNCLLLSTTVRYTVLIKTFMYTNL